MLSAVAYTFALLLLPNLIHSSTPRLVESGSRDNSAECDCYLTSGPNPGYFQYYRFYDFRSITAISDDDHFGPPNLITNSENQGDEPVTNSYFNTTTFNDNWSIESGNVSDIDNTYNQVNSAQNVYITRNTSSPDAFTYLTLRTNRNEDFQSTAEIDCNQKNLMHSSIRARLRVIANATTADDPGVNSTHPVSPGAVVGFFTYESNTQESDIEILTSDPINHIRYSNQPDYDAETGNTVPGASTDYQIQNGNIWTEWLTHRLDWYPGVTQWWIDDEILLNKTLNVPRKPSGMILNVWSDGGEWSGNMSVGEQVVVGVEWIEVVFNVSGKVEGPGKRWTDGLRKRKERMCKVGCWVDAPHSTVPGQPVVVFNSTSGATRAVTDSTLNGLGMLYGLALISGLYVAFF